MWKIEKLIDGYQRFYRCYFEEQPERYERLFKVGQSPGVMIVACCDSRVPPEQITDAVPGDVFTVRNVANLVPENAALIEDYSTCAAVEFAVRSLGVRHIIIMGHSQCGGIRRLMEGDTDQTYDFVDSWMKSISHVRKAVLDVHSGKPFAEQCAFCEKASIVNSLENLKTFPWLKEKVDAGELSLHGWYFDIGTGNLLVGQDDEFIPLDGTGD